jgi:predicted peptidase
MRRSILDQRLDQLPVRMEQHELLLDRGSITYGVLVPKTPAPAAGYPLIVALHYGTTQEPGLSPYFGLGYVGQLVLPALQDLNAVIVAPDAPEASWAHPASEAAVLAVVADVRKRVAFDAQRTLVTGFSMGGSGAWFFAATHPELFRAAIPMAAAPRLDAAAGGATPGGRDQAAPAADAAVTPVRMPVYVIHSRADRTVPLDRVERGVKALQAQGGQVTLVLIDDVAHNMIPGFIDPLAAAIPWVKQVWGG